MSVKGSFKRTRTEDDLDKIEYFKQKIKVLKDNSSMDDFEQLRVMDKALNALNITNEPIEKYYFMGEAIGSGKFGLVRQATRIFNDGMAKGK